MKIFEIVVDEDGDVRCNQYEDEFAFNYEMAQVIEGLSPESFPKWESKIPRRFTDYSGRYLIRGELVVPTQVPTAMRYKLNPDEVE